MSFPAHLLLPIVGAVLLVLALVGSWLWPEPTAPAPSVSRPAISAPVAVEPSAPPPPSRPPPPPPVARAEPLPKAAVIAPEPTREEPPPPPPPPEPQVNLHPPAQHLAPNGLLRIRERSLGVAMKAMESLEIQRDAARELGNEAEVQRLEALIRLQRERIENIKAAPQDLPAPPKLELPSE